MEKKITKPVNEFEDSLIVAFLALRGHQVTPYKRRDTGRVIFEVVGDIARDIEAFYLNQEVGVRDYVGMVKWVRKSIFNLKAIK
jgi:hypothetical protein